MHRTRSPVSRSATPRLSVVVVFATPPFWFANANTRVVSGTFSGTGDPKKFGRWSRRATAMYAACSVRVSSFLRPSSIVSARTRSADRRCRGFGYRARAPTCRARRRRRLRRGHRNIGRRAGPATDRGRSRVDRFDAHDRRLRSAVRLDLRPRLGLVDELAQLAEQLPRRRSAPLELVDPVETLEHACRLSGAAAAVLERRRSLGSRRLLVHASDGSPEAVTCL